MTGRAIIVEQDGYTMRYTPRDDNWSWDLEVTVPAETRHGVKFAERTFKVDLERAGGEPYTTGEVLYQVGLVAYDVAPAVNTRAGLDEV